MIDYQKCFIDNLKRFRKAKGLTQAQLAEKCDVSNGTIGNIETGITKPSFDLILQISAVLDIKPEALFHTNESQPKSEKTSSYFTNEQLKKIKSVLATSMQDVMKTLKN
ncbi:MAG: helix-turn-helix transcriptional regulator [Treponema sp.]|nr:helix-turn-helix transcriptional regulator [Treponema sp.]